MHSRPSRSNGRSSGAAEAQRKKKEPKAPRVIYVSDSDEDDYQQPPDINQLYSFV